MTTVGVFQAQKLKEQKQAEAAVIRFKDLCANVNSNEPINILANGQGKQDGKWTNFFAINNFVVSTEELNKYIEMFPKAAYHFPYGDLTIFLECREGK